MTSNHYLPSKIPTFLKRLQIEYASDDKPLLAAILRAGRLLVIEETDYDNWNGGTYGHDVKFFLPVEVLGRIKVREQDTVADEIQSDLNLLSKSIENEHIRAVVFELENEEDPEFQQASLLSQRTRPDPNGLAIWKPGQIRLFISHRDAHKIAAKSLGVALEGYGISAFVAHDTIQPMSAWQHEILKGLQTMEAMLAFITEDFDDSTWTNQEIGFALGRDIPVISLKLGKSDPNGFIGNVQALRGHLDSPEASAPEIYRLISEKLGSKHRLQGALISVFLQSSSFYETRDRFERLVKVVKKLTGEEIQQITREFSENDQLHNAIYLTNDNERLRKFLERCTGSKFTVTGKRIIQAKAEAADTIPF